MENHKFTKLAKKERKTLTFGVFDLFHLGHLRLIKRAKENTDYLIVAIQNDDKILKYKPGIKIFNNFSERKEMLEAIKYVDKVIPYDDVDKDICQIDFDILILGEDQNHAGFQKAIEWCQANDKEIIILSRTQGISSSQIRENKG